MTEPPPPAAAPDPVLLDACVVLSLYATGRFERILAVAARGAVVNEVVVRESLFVYRAGANGRERVPVEL